VPLHGYRSAGNPLYHRPMHGVIFSSFRDFALTRFGPDVAKEILSGRPVHVMSDAYDDEEFDALLLRACEVAGVEAETLMHEFGRFIGLETFPRLYPAFFTVAGGTRPFLLTVEDRIHELVRATIPKADPPQLVVEPLGEDGVRIAYSSRRHLCGLLAGMLEGTAAYYGDAVAYEQRTCMHRGDATCVFEVRVSSRAPVA
jgi:predicted hydrocarbon binding protein